MIKLFEYVKGILLRATTYDSAAHDKEGAVYVEDDSGNKIKTYLDGSKREVLTEDQAQIVTNKTIDADSNTITNIENADIKSGAAIDATKIADGSVTSAEFQYLSTVTSNVQDQIDSKASSTGLSDHINDTTDAHAGSAITNTPTGNLAATTVQAALDELQSDVDNRATSTQLSDHISDTSTHGITSEILGSTETQNVSNKTITASSLSGGSVSNTDINLGTASDTQKVVLSKNTSTNLTGLTREEASIYYDTTLQKPVIDNGTVLTPIGGGSGGDFDFLANKTITDFFTYKDAAQSTPVNGIDGTAAAISVGISPSPINTETGVLNLRISKSAANGQGEGVSVDFDTRGAIDRASIRTAVISITSSANYADGDVGVYLYDVTNSRLIYPADQDVYGSSFVSSQQFSFQLLPDSDSYRLITHCQTTNALAYDLDCVVKFVESKKVTGSIANWPQYDLTVTGSGVTSTRAVGIPYKTITGDWRLKFNLVVGMASAARTGVTLNIDGVLFKNIAGYSQSITASTNGSSDAPSTYGVINTGNIVLYHASTSTIYYAASGDVELESQPSWAVDYSNQVFSEDVSSRSIGLLATKSGAQTITAGAGDTIVTTWSKSNDEASIFDAPTGIGTIPETGWYDFSLNGIFSTVGTAPASAQFFIVVGSTSFARFYRETLVASKTYYEGTSGPLYCTKGQTFAVKAASAGQNISFLAGSIFTVNKRSSPQQIAASEKVFAYYESNASQSIETGTTGEAFICEDKVVDSHGIYNPSTGVITPNKSGLLKIRANALFASSAGWALGEAAYFSLMINGTAVRFFGNNIMQATATYTPLIGNSVSYPISKGDTATVFIYQNSGATIALANLNTVNFIEIEIE